jgi:hypothetical protein
MISPPVMSGSIPPFPSLSPSPPGSPITLSPHPLSQPVQSSDDHAISIQHLPTSPASRSLDSL